MKEASKKSLSDRERIKLRNKISALESRLKKRVNEMKSQSLTDKFNQRIDKLLAIINKRLSNHKELKMQIAKDLDKDGDRKDFSKVFRDSMMVHAKEEKLDETYIEEIEMEDVSP